MIATLTTDFGLRDGYAAAMRGAMLRVAPSLRIEDISHTIAPQETMEAAFVLRRAARFFPEGTVHAVVVGSRRTARPVAAELTLDGVSHTVVAPDTGVVTLLDADEIGLCVELDRPEHWRVPEPVPSFRGRDLYGPVAAALAGGARLDAVGTPIDDARSLRWAVPSRDDAGIDGWVVHVDRYGSCITNIPAGALAPDGDATALRIFAGSTIIRGVSRSHGAGAPGEPLAVLGGDGFLEIAVAGGDASQLLSIERGQQVRVVFDARPVPA